MNFVNLTPHQISLNDGRVFEPSGIVPRVQQFMSDFDGNGVAIQSFGEVENMPLPKADTIYIVSAMVLSALGKDRQDCVAPATNHAKTIRNEKGHIVSVPGFVR